MGPIQKGFQTRDPRALGLDCRFMGLLPLEPCAPLHYRNPLDPSIRKIMLEGPKSHSGYSIWDLIFPYLGASTNRDQDDKSQKASRRLRATFKPMGPMGLRLVGRRI